MNRTTRSMTDWVPLGLALALAIGAPCGAARAADEPPKEEATTGADTVVVNTKEGKTLAKKGEIVAETAAKVVIKIGGKETTIKREEINRVDYGGTGVFGQAEGQLSKGDYEFASSSFKKIVDDASLRAVLRQRALVGYGRALAGSGKFDEAAAAYQQAAKATGTMVREAVRECVRALIRGKSAAKALAIANEAKATYKDAELPEEAQDEAQLLKAEALEASGNAGEARSIYNLLTNSRDPKVRGRAALGAARAAFAGKEHDRAAGMYLKILDEKDIERSVRCGAARGLGDVLVQKLAGAKDFQKLRAAASAYAQALAVHSPARGEETLDREAALNEGAKVYDTLAELCTGDKDGKGRELYESLAKQYREELVKLYKTSPYRQEAELKLAKSGSKEPAADAPKSIR